MADLSPPQLVPPNPFVGPVPFVEGQVLYGRRRETQALADLVIGKRVVLLIAPSGAGKTSLIQAALLPRLRARLNPLPIVRLGRAPDAQGSGVNRYLLSTLCAIESGLPEGQRLPPEELAHLTLAAYLRDRAGRVGGASAAQFQLLVLDQFEELFTLDRLDWADKEAFLGQLGQALGGGGEDQEGDPDGGIGAQASPLWALVSMREDYVAELEPFLHLIPTGFGFRYRLGPLERTQAIEAATATAGDFLPQAAAEVLVDDLRTLAAAPGGGEERRRLGRFVEPVQLQVVCLRLWDQVVAGQGRPITAADIAPGGQGNAVDTALGAYYDRLVYEAAAAAGVRRRELRDWIETRLISGSKMRTRVLREARSLDPALNLLVGRHLLRVDLTGDREWLELSHDRLVDPILASNEAWRVENLALFQRQAKLWAEGGRPDDMLFSGGELADALVFAEAHPESLSDDDKLFLEKSRGLRERAEAELERTRQIERQAREIAIKNDEIRAKNKRLRTWRLWLSVLGTAAVVTAIWLFVTREELERKRVEIEVRKGQVEAANTELQHRSLFGRLKRSVALARGGAPEEAYAELIPIADEIRSKRVDFLQLGLDQGLIQALGNQAPVERRLGGHDHIVRVLRFSSDGGRLYSGGWDDRLKTWSIGGAGGVEDTQEAHRADIRTLAYHRGRHLLVSTDEAGSVLLWSLEDQGPRLLHDLNQDRTAHPRAVWAAAISPDGLTLATAGKDKRILLWDLADLAHPRRIGAIQTRFHRHWIYGLAFIPDGLYAGSLVSVDWGGRVGIWRTPLPGADAEREPDLALYARGTEGTPVALFGLAVSPDGRWVAVGDNRGGVRAWDLDSDAGPGEERRFPYYESHRGNVLALEFSADSSTLVTVGSDGVLIRWSLPFAAETAEEFYEQLRVRRFEGWGEKLYSVAFRPGSSEEVAVGGAKTIWLANLSRANPLASGVAAGDPSETGWSAIAATPELVALAALSRDGKIHRWHWDGAAYRPLPSIETPERLDQIALAPDGLTLAGLSCKGKLLIYPLSRPHPAAPLVLGEPAADASRGSRECAVAFAPDGQSLATGVGATLRLWSRTQSGNWQAADVQQVPGTLLALAFSPGGERLAGAGRFDRLLVWDLVEGHLVEPPVRTNEPLGEIVPALAFDPTGELVITGAEDALVTTWSLPGLVRHSRSGAHDRRLTALATARRLGVPVLVSGDAEGQLVLCMKAVEDRQCGRLGRPSQRDILGLAANADFTRLVVADEAGIWVWDLRRESMLDRLRRLSR
jgi:WD40 repeat protein